jgi:Tfp pilus assembly protein PilN
MRAVNLLPGDAGRDRAKPQAPLLVGVVGAVAVTALVCGGFLMKSSEVRRQQETLRLAQAELAAIPPAPVVVQAEPELKQARDTRLAAVSTALGRRMTWDAVLRRFSQVLPGDVWLTSLSVASPLTGAPGAPPAAAPTGPTTGGMFLLSGYSYSHDAVARLLARLSAVPDLTEVQLQRSEQTKLEGRDVVTFSIQAIMRAGGVSS